MRKMITTRPAAKLACIFAMAFIAWSALGMPVPQYRYLLSGETVVIEREEWRCVGIEVGTNGKQQCISWKRRDGK